MPSAAKVKWAQLRVGIMAAAALALVGFLVFLMTGNESLFARHVTVYTYMDDSAALPTGSAVRLNGILIGKVARVELSGEREPNRIIRLVLDVEERQLGAIPVDSEVSIGAENLLGTKYINIKKGQAKETARPGTTLPSKDVREFQDLVNAAYPTLGSLQVIAKRLEKIIATVESGQGSIGKLIVEEDIYNGLVDTVQEAKKVMQALSSGRGTLGRLLYDEALYDDVRGSVARVNTLLDGLQQGEGTAGKLLKDPALYDDARKTIAELKRVVDDLNAGKGTAGKLLKDEQLHKQMSDLVAHLDETIVKLNQGQGTMGQLLVNPQLYESLNGAMREMNSLMKDFRANPKKFLRIQLKLF